MSDIVVAKADVVERPRSSGALAPRRLPTAASTPRIERPRAWWGEELLALFSIIVALGADLLLVRVGLDSVDEGYFVEQARRVVSGQVPYRDFDSLYTPALLYVHAAMLAVFRDSPILDVRIVGLVARLVLAGGLYVLCRPLVRPAYAALPSLYILVALDRLPLTWEPHPGWPSAALSVVAALAYARLPLTTGFRQQLLLVTIGAVAALVFALKQNAGVLLGLALVVGAAWQGIDPQRTDVTRALRRLQLLLVALVVAVVAWLLRPHASPTILAFFLIPIVSAVFAAVLPVRVSATGRGIGSWLRVLGWLGLGWTTISLPWLLPLLVAIDWNVVLLKGFVGLVNQDLLWYPPQWPSGGAWASLLGLGVGVLALVRCRRRPFLCAIVLLVVLTFAASTVLLTREAGEPILVALALAPGRASDGLGLILPVVWIVASAFLSFGSMPAPTRWWLRWMTVASALTFLTEYPRVDDTHLAWSACLPLATGTVVLASFSRALTRRWRVTGAGRFLVTTALLLVPIAVGLRNMSTRSDGLAVLGDQGGLSVQFAPTTMLTDPRPVAGMIVSADQANTLVDAARFVAANTALGEAIFVFPTSPLVYVLADRPNPTRFDHLFPDAASPAEVDRVIATLDALPVRIVMVSETDLAFWGPPEGNAPLEAYLAGKYHQIGQFSEYRVLRRN
jgi:hypothetical protein